MIHGQFLPKSSSNWRFVIQDSMVRGLDAGEVDLRNIDWAACPFLLQGILISVNYFCNGRSKPYKS